MTKEQFTQDLQAVYLELQDRQAELNGFYALTEEEHPKAAQTVEAFLQLLELPKNDDTVMAALTRIVNLREDALEQVMQKEGLDEAAIRLKKELAYGFVSMMHITRHESLIGWVEERKLLTPFYRSLMFGVHFVGLRLSEWQSHWTHHIINTVNPELSELFGGDDAKVFEMLQAEALLDRDENGNIADRSYSVLVKENISTGSSTKEGSLAEPVEVRYKSVAYAEAFEKEVGAVVVALEQLIALLRQHEDEVFGQKQEWIAYFTAIKEAFAHK